MTKKQAIPTKTPSALGPVLGAAMFGAIIGGAAAAAKGIRDVKSGRATAESAAMDTAREAGTTAIAAGAAAVVVGALPVGPVLSTLGIAAVAVGTKYAMDSVLSPGKPEPAPAPVAAAKASAATPVATAAKKAKKATPAKAKPKKAAAPKKTTKKSTAKKPAAQDKAKPDTI